MNGRFDLDLDNAWTPDGRISLKGALPIELLTPDARWAYGLTVPIHVTEDSAPLRRARLQLSVQDLRGRIRIGIVSRDGTRFVISRIPDQGAADTITFPISQDLDIGSLVFQNASEHGSSQITIKSVEWVNYPVERDTHLSNYMKRGFNATEGWCHYLNIGFLRAFDELLFAFSVDGGICEIGVHHGKQFIALHNLMEAGAKSIAIDVFGAQELNLDGSGHGDYGKFQDNLKKWGVSPENCLTLARDSLSLSAREIEDLAKRVGPVKFFGIDGCHEVEHTLADLRSAMRMTTAGGVIILDDFLNPDFPGVHQALAYLFIHDRPGIAPFLIGQNKVYLTQVSHHDKYLSAAGDIVKSFPETDSVREVNLYGYRSLSWRTSETSWNFPEVS